MEQDETRWMRVGLEQEIRDLEGQLQERRTRFMALGGAKAGRPKGTRKPMSEETREKLKAAQLKRWAARKRIEKEIEASKSAKKR